MEVEESVAVEEGVCELASEEEGSWNGIGEGGLEQDRGGDRAIGEGEE